jgi:arginyl-tRNA synthetase
MNIFTDIRTLVTETLDAMVAEGRLPNGLSWGPVTVEPPRDAATGTWRRMPRWCWPSPPG